MDVLDEGDRVDAASAEAVLDLLDRAVELDVGEDGCVVERVRNTVDKAVGVDLLKAQSGVEGVDDIFHGEGEADLFETAVVVEAVIERLDGAGQGERFDIAEILEAVLNVENARFDSHRAELGCSFGGFADDSDDVLVVVGGGDGEVALGVLVDLTDDGFILNVGVGGDEIIGGAGFLQIADGREGDSLDGFFFGLLFGGAAAGGEYQRAEDDHAREQ